MHRRDVLRVLAAAGATFPVPYRAAGRWSLRQAGDPLDTLIREHMTQHHVPGVAIAVVEEGVTSTVRSYGLRHADDGGSVTEDTVFEAASLSKPTFAWAAMRLVGRGALDLDRPLGEYLDAPYVENEPRLSSITARLVLSHQSGFPNWRRGEPLRVTFPPGSRFGYSGEGYVYLQRVLERVTGRALDQLVETEVFTPLGMRASRYTWHPAYDNRAAAGHGRDGAPQPKHRPELANAAASLHTTAADFARLLGAVIRPSSGPQLLDFRLHTEMLEPQVRIDDHLAWGLGWGLERADEGWNVWHWGDNDGFKAFTVGDLVTGNGLVLLTNGDGGLNLAPPVVTHVLVGLHPALVFRMLNY